MELACLWYGSFRSRTVRVILVRDDKSRTRGRDDRGYGLPLVTTDLELSAEDVVARYASRWGIEQAFKLRRVIIAARFRSPCPEQATPQETQAVLAAWAAAST